MNVFRKDSLKQLADLLHRPVYLVGGYVRNAVLGVAHTDMDLAGAMSSEEVAGCLCGSRFAFGPVNARLGTIGIRNTDSGDSYEYTAFRREFYAEGGGHVPNRVEFTDSLQEDARRRDFTANAIYCEVKTGEICDPLGGIASCKEKKLIAADLPEKVFASDGLRVLRLCRQASELGFTIEESTFCAARDSAGLLADISAERIREELEKILHADTKYPGFTAGTFAQYRGLKLLWEVGALSVILPELALGAGMAQRPDFHRYDVLEHTIQTVKYSDGRVRLAALLHDIAKPSCMLATGKFAGHEIAGVELSAKILRRLRYPVRIVQRVSRLVGLHMLDLDGRTRESKVRLKIAENYDVIEELLLLKQADYLGGGLCDGTSPVVKKWRDIIAVMQADGTPFQRTRLKLTSEEIMRDYGLSGKSLGKTIDALWQAAVCCPERNETKTALREYLEKNLL